MACSTDSALAGINIPLLVGNIIPSLKSFPQKIVRVGLMRPATYAGTVSCTGGASGRKADQPLTRLQGRA